MSLVLPKIPVAKRAVAILNLRISSTAVNLNSLLEGFPQVTAEEWSRISTNRQLFFCLIRNSFILFIPLALLQFFLYPFLLHDSIVHWLSYWFYLFFGVILPGTLLIVRYTSWRMDWLTWMGLGWAVGHGLELVSLLAARNFNASGLFIMWIPAAYLLFFKRQHRWSDKVRPVSNRGQICIALIVLFTTGAFQYYSSNLLELSSRPPMASDIWYHINNAHEFRDHAVMQNPRLAGEPFNYHTFSYAPAAAASLVTGDLLANLMVRYAGLNCVWLFTLLMFNASRSILSNHILAATIGVFLFLFPIDIMQQFSSHLDAGTVITVWGLYASTSTLGGYCFIMALILPLFWFYQSPRWQDSPLIILMVFGGAGAKVMLGPLFLSAVLGMIGWGVIFRSRAKYVGKTIEQFPYSWKTSFVALGLILLPVLAVSTALIFGEGSYSDTIRWVYNAFADTVPFYTTLLSTLHLSDILLRTIWIFSFAPITLLGASITTLVWRKNTSLSMYAALAWTIFSASLVASMIISLGGQAQLFFLLYGLSVLNTVMGYGIVELSKFVLSSIPRRIGVFGALLAMFIVAQILAPSPPVSLFDSSVYSIWPLQQYELLQVFAGGPANQQTSGPIPYVGQAFVLTNEIRDALSWARQHLSKDDVFAVNVIGAAPYSGYSERRAFYETTLYTVESQSLQGQDLVGARYGWRDQLIQDWRAGKSDVLARMKQVGITYIFVDRVNGMAIPNLEGLPSPVFENKDFAIYLIT
jgi:hypothetical protein